MPTAHQPKRKAETSWIAESVGYMRPESTLYNCPVYLTTFRGPTYTCLATLKTKLPIEKWVLAGVALVMQSDGEA